MSAEQYNALTQHIPASVVVMTLVLVFLGTAATGFSFARMQSRPTVFTVIYIIALTMVFQMIVDYDRPQTGLVHVSLDALQTQIDAMRPH